MGSEIPMVQPIFQSSKRSQMELSKSLAILGFGSWNELEPEALQEQSAKNKNSKTNKKPESDKREGKTVRERLNESLNAKLYEVEKKREKGILLDKKIAKLPDGQERRKLIYQKQQQDNYNRRHKKFPIDEERALHESYQIIMKETEIRRIRKTREAERLARHTDGTGSVTSFRPSESGNNTGSGGGVINSAPVEEPVQENPEESELKFEKPAKKKKNKKKNKEKERKDSDADTEDGVPDLPEMDDLLIAADSVF